MTSEARGLPFLLPEIPLLRDAETTSETLDLPNPDLLVRQEESDGGRGPVSVGGWRGTPTQGYQARVSGAAVVVSLPEMSAVLMQ